MKKLFLTIFIGIGLQNALFAYTVNSLPNPKATSIHNYVCNPDGILHAQTVTQVNTILDSLEARTRAEVAVVVINTIEDQDIDTFGNELFKKWGIGKKNENNGILMLVVIDQHRTTFETGYGMEGILNDGLCKQIQRKMIPSFKANNYDQGVLIGVNQVDAIIRQEPPKEAPSEPIHWDEILPIAIGAYLLIILFSIIWISNAAKRIRNSNQYKTNIEKYLGLKTEKQGIVSLLALILPIISFILVLLFWNPIFLLLVLPIPLTAIPCNIIGKMTMRKIRREPIPCRVCGAKMHLLSEKEEDTHLKIAQQFEEQLHSIDYDVFVCDECKNEAIFTLDKPSAYTECPKCKTKAFILKEKRVIVAPTPFTSGTEKITYHCKFCGYEESENHRIPKQGGGNTGALVGGAILGSMISGRGGFGGSGGDFGGSFGGGMSGGGGATSSW